MHIDQETLILDAAYHCISRDGYAHTSLRHIAKEAGVVLSQISYHYQSKEGLLLAVVARAANKYQNYMAQNFEPKMTSKEKGERFIAMFQEVLEKDPGVFRVIYDLAGLAMWSEPLRKKVQEVFAEMIDGIREIFDTKELQETKPDFSAEALSIGFSGGLFGIAIQSLLQPERKEICDSLKTLAIIFGESTEIQQK